MSFMRFLIYDSLGAVIWAAAFILLGFLFSDQIERIEHEAGRWGTEFAALIVLGALAAYLIAKYLRRRRFLQQFRMKRITPEDLKQKLDAGEPVAIVDVRHVLDVYSHPYMLPGAIRLPLEQSEQRANELPRDREIVVYCTCPNEASSIRAVSRFQRKGFQQVRPLAGGLQGWRDRGFPVQQFDFSTAAGQEAFRPIWAF